MAIFLHTLFGNIDRRSGGNRSILSMMLPLTSLLLLFSLSACGGEGEQPGDRADDTTGAAGKNERIISLGGSVTETVFALGHGDQVIAVDITSTWPEQTSRLQQVGYFRTLSAESIIALNPTLVLASSEAQPSAALEQIRSVGIPVVIVPEEPTVDGVREKILAVARGLGEEERGKRLADSVIAALPEDVKKPEEEKPSVLFVYARGSGSLHAAGSNTSAERMISLAGGRNAAVGYEGFRPLTAEGLVAADPDILLVPKSGVGSAGGLDGLLKTTGIDQTSAGKAKRVIVMDDLYLLGLGPRLPGAVADLRKKIAQAMEKGE